MCLRDQIYEGHDHKSKALHQNVAACLPAIFSERKSVGGQSSYFSASLHFPEYWIVGYSGASRPARKVMPEELCLPEDVRVGEDADEEDASSPMPLIVLPRSLTFPGRASQMRKVFTVADFALTTPRGVDERTEGENESERENRGGANSVARWELKDCPTPGELEGGSPSKKPPGFVMLRTRRAIVLRALLRGFLVGFGMRGGLSLFSIILSSFKAASLRKGRNMRRQGSMLTAVMDGIKFGSFLGGYTGGYRAIDAILQRVFGKKESSVWRAFVSGGLASPAVYLAGPAPYTNLTLYLTIRAVVLTTRQVAAHRHYRFLSIPHGDTLLMCIASCQVLWSWLLEPQTLPSAYVKFLDHHGGKGRSVLDAIRSAAQHGHWHDQLDQVRAWHASSRSAGAIGCERTAAAWPFDPTCCNPMHISHPHQGPLTHFLAFFPGGVARSLRVYAPIYLIPALFIHRASLLKREKALRVMARSGLGMARSSLFLATYCSGAWLALDIIHTLKPDGRVNMWTIMATTLFPGLAVLLEKPSRRLDLGIYVATRALESAGILLVKRGWLPHMRRPDAILLSLGGALLMNTYTTSPETFGSKYVNLLDWMLGYKSFSRGDSLSSLLF